MAEISLQGPRVGALVCQRVATGMAQHVRMHLKGHSGLNACPLDQLSQASNRERCTAFAHENKRRLRLTLECSQRSKFIAKQGMCAGTPPLARRRCSVAVSNSTSDHWRPQSSDALRPCRKVINSIVLSRCPHRLPLAASISFSTSRSVKCSLGLNSALGRRRNDCPFHCCWRD